LKTLLLLLLSISSSLLADKVIVEAMACPNMDIMKNASQYDDDFVALNKYAIANGCKFLNLQDPIEAIDYDPALEKSIYIKILEKRSGSVLYIKREHVLIEKPGKKNNFRF
jgi:hypothetical protein